MGTTVNGDPVCVQVILISGWRGGQDSSQRFSSARRFIEYLCVEEPSDSQGAVGNCAARHTLSFA